MNKYQLDTLLSSADDVISGSKNQCMCPGHKKGAINIAIPPIDIKSLLLGVIGAYLLFGRKGNQNKHIQGYDDRRDESLSARLGAERKFQHGKYSISEHGRMDDSYGVHGHRGLKGPMMPGY